MNTTEFISTSPNAMTGSIATAHPGTMRLWTIQPLAVWEKLCEKGTLWVDASQEGFSQELRAEYDWMCRQMEQRLPEYTGHYPWWAYDYKLDLRSFRHQIQEGRQVRLELALPPQRVLFSAYGAWHCVLNRFYLPHAVDDEQYEREGNAWEEELTAQGLNAYQGEILPEPWESRMKASWDRIFDVDDLRDTNTIQACFERLDLNDVVQATKFMSAKR